MINFKAKIFWGSVFRRHRILIIFLFVFCLILLFLFFLFQPQKVLRNSATQVDSPNHKARMWEITLSYEPKSDKIYLQKIKIVDGNISKSPLSLSPYQIRVLNQRGEVIYMSYIHFTNQLYYELYFPPNAKKSGFNLAQPGVLDSLVSIPYFTQAHKIQILKANQPVFEFIPPKDKPDLSLIRPVFAAEKNACRPLSLVFISEGYTDSGKFKIDAEKMKNALFSIEPYASRTEIFETKIVENSVNLGCIENGQLLADCVGSGVTLEKIKAQVNKKYPVLSPESDYTKYIILADTQPTVIMENGVYQGSILGASNGPGGQFAVFQTRSFPAMTAVHEVGGHAIGWLYDRYVWDNGYSRMGLGAMSNCSDKPTGEAGWNGQAFPGCSVSKFYAPTKPTCPAAGPFATQGTPDSLMSAAGCADETNPRFDAVEKAWISNLLKNYTACGKEQLSQPPSTSQASPVPSTPYSKSDAGYNCRPDPKCNLKKNVMQICALICTPK